MSLDRFLERRYRPGSYNCAHFVVEVWKELTGQDLSSRLHGVLCPPTQRELRQADLGSIRLLNRPVSPCLVLMRRDQLSHIGIWYKGRVLHLLESQTAVQYMPIEIASIGYPKIRFFLCD